VVGPVPAIRGCLSAAPSRVNRWLRYRGTGKTEHPSGWRQIRIGDVVATIRDAIAGTEGIDGVRELRTIHIGPDDLVVVADIWVDAASSATAIGRSIDDAERRVREVAPFRTVVSIEPHVRETERDGR
jgi:hypothetical protein